MEETRIDNQKSHKISLPSWGYLAPPGGSCPGLTVDLNPSGCFLPSPLASPLHRPVSSIIRFSVVTQSHCTPASGPHLGVPWRRSSQMWLKMQAALLEVRPLLVAERGSPDLRSLLQPWWYRNNDEMEMLEFPPQFHFYNVVVYGGMSSRSLEKPSKCWLGEEKAKRNSSLIVFKSGKSESAGSSLVWLTTQNRALGALIRFRSN